jgi:hypothetical protein
MTSDQLMNRFKRYGATNASCKNKLSKTFGFVTFVDWYDAIKAEEIINKSNFNKQQILCKIQVRKGQLDETL